MCITIPAKIISIKEGNGFILSGKRKLKIKLSAVKNIKKGDWVLVYGDMAVKKISAKEAKDINRELKNAI